MQETHYKLKASQSYIVRHYLQKQTPQTKGKEGKKEKQVSASTGGFWTTLELFPTCEGKGTLILGKQGWEVGV